MKFDDSTTKQYTMMKRDSFDNLTNENNTSREKLKIVHISNDIHHRNWTIAVSIMDKG